jgi:hypothetical protein
MDLAIDKVLTFGLRLSGCKNPILKEHNESVERQ